MVESKPQLIRIVSYIRDQLLTLRQGKQRQIQSRATGLIEQMNRLVRIRRKPNLCEIRNWQAAGGGTTSSRRDSILTMIRAAGMNTAPKIISRPRLIALIREFLRCLHLGEARSA